MKPLCGDDSGGKVLAAPRTPGQPGCNMSELKGKALFQTLRWRAMGDDP